jgi:hypothetical protein
VAAPGPGNRFIFRSVRAPPLAFAGFAIKLLGRRESGLLRRFGYGLPGQLIEQASKSLGKRVNSQEMD